MSRPRLRLLHETNPQKYFPALYLLAERGAVELVGAHRYSVAKEWLRAGLIDKTPVAQRTKNALADLWFRLTAGRAAGEVIVIGFAPWDWRLLVYRHLARRNRILYHTSWHDWRAGQTPRQPWPGVFRAAMMRRWRAFLHDPNVRTIAVTPAVQASLAREMGVAATVVPHAVPEVFFAAGAARAAGRPEAAPGLRLLFVGELSRKKGLLTLLEMMPRLAARGVSLTVVGDGPLAAEVARAGAGVRALGRISDRAELARIMAGHDVLVLPSQRSEGWEELFGIVIIEALAAGMAVLCSDHIGPRGILAAAGGAGLFDQEDHAGFEAEIARLAQDRAALDSLRAAQAPLAESYSAISVAEQWRAEIERD